MGRTLNIPKELKPGVIPGPSFNSAISIGEPCKGNWCALPIKPFGTNYAAFNADINQNSEQSHFHYPNSERLGNSTVLVTPGLKQYKGTPSNPGPFNIKVIDN